MSIKAKTILAEPGQLLMIFIPLLILYLFNFTLSTLVGRSFFRRGDGIALVYGTVMRNLSIALAIAINAFGPEGADAALVIALAYIIQVQSAAWYVKLTEPLPPCSNSLLKKIQYSSSSKGVIDYTRSDKGGLKS